MKLHFLSTLFLLCWTNLWRLWLENHFFQLLWISWWKWLLLVSLMFSFGGRLVYEAEDFFLMKSTLRHCGAIWKLTRFLKGVFLILKSLKVIWKIGLFENPKSCIERKLILALLGIKGRSMNTLSSNSSTISIPNVLRLLLKNISFLSNRSYL